MRTVKNILLCSLVVLITQGEVVLEADRPFLQVQLYQKAVLQCCYTTTTTVPVKLTWIRLFHDGNVTKGPHVVKVSDLVTEDKTVSDKECGTLTFKSVQLGDTGMYQCHLNGTKVDLLTHGTYLQVYKQLKTINLSESTKNKILTAEGILLFLCVLVPGVSLLFQSKKLNELEKKKVKKEEENIYQGLDLDNCCTTYDQIERSQAHGPYQDVCNIVEEEEEIQLEKP